jgi:uncharacterized membrane protein
MIELLVLRLVHVLGGIFWVGSAMFMTVFLLPAIAKAGPSAGSVLGALRARGLLGVLPVVALLTMASGVRLLWIISGGFAAGYFQSATGRTYAGAGIAAIVSFLISLLVARPAAIRTGQLGATLGSATADQRAAVMLEMERLRQRAAVANGIVLALLVLAAAGMALGRYVQ